jgi:hypothetical protein
MNTTAVKTVDNNLGFVYLFSAINLRKEDTGMAANKLMIETVIKAEL